MWYQKFDSYIRQLGYHLSDSNPCMYMQKLEDISLVVKMTNLWLLLGVMETGDIEFEQLDVKTTFLHGDLEEDIYMSQPVSFTATGEEGHSYVD